MHFPQAIQIQQLAYSRNKKTVPGKVLYHSRRMKEDRREATICIHQHHHQDIGNNYNLESKEKFNPKKKILRSFV